jgi:hypothetical protein
MTTPTVARSICPALSNKYTAIPGVVQEISFLFTGGTTTEKDTGIDLPAKSIVIDLVVDVKTAVASSTIDVGLLSTEGAGDADGFADGVSCASAVLVQPAAVLTAGNTTSSWTSSTYGTFLQDLETAVTTSGLTGIFNRKYHLSTDVTAKSLSYTTTTHATEGTVHLFYIPL